MMNNENKELSRNRKKRIERKIRMDDRMKPLLNKISTEKKKKYKNNGKIKNLQIELVKIKYADSPKKLESASGELNKIEVFDRNLHEIKPERMIEYEGELKWLVV